MVNLRKLCSEQSDMMQEVGFSKPLTMIEVTEKTLIIRAVSAHYVLLRCKAELDQLKAGLSALGLLDELCANPSIIVISRLVNTPNSYTSTAYATPYTEWPSPEERE